MKKRIAELLQYRELLLALVGRHLSMRYRGSALGFLWSFLNPLLLMLVYTLVFRFYIRFDQVENYSVFLFCGLLPWIWVTSSLHEGASSIVASGHLITKSLFPAQLLPSVAVITSMVHFLLSLPILFAFMFVSGMSLHYTMLLVPFVIFLQFVFCFGLALALSAVNVQYRDVQHILGNVLTFLFFLCPILYPIESVPEAYRFTLELNPFSLFTMFYHDLILDGVVPPLHQIVLLAGFSTLSFVMGHMIFEYNRESFAELL
ncbi:MAG: ABC transporter permease [Deltaproteobacteria bacterium]|nr:ABC transporter permease [Deltaproteobacteria bacterium]